MIFPALSLLRLRTLNGDGKPDLIVETTGDGLQILIGNGDGTFQSLRTIVQRQPKEGGLGCGHGVPFVANDFNGDGKPDLLVGTYAALYFYAGNGDGTIGGYTSAICKIRQSLGQRLFPLRHFQRAHRTAPGKTGTRFGPPLTVPVRIFFNVETQRFRIQG